MEGNKKVKTYSGVCFGKICKIEAVESGAVIVSGAKWHPELEKSQRVLALGSEGLVAVEAKYHNSCKHKFLRETGKRDTRTRVEKSSRKLHQEAFAVLVKFVKN